ncbi:hypothetical protein B296_00001829 [Ensete ventricosum]|uniref:Uncharacterized protein n=1 Tax=Ensete ventricosum TaxID=4639 RepID=A0A427AJ86_ENSVE|nr:hypothetical protein B296_00001829 [Ensete ventricosum]
MTSVGLFEAKLEAFETRIDAKLQGYTTTGHLHVPTLAGYTNQQKLKSEGFLEQQAVIVLIDAGSTHNFISSKVAAHLMLQKEDYNRFEVKVANGQILKCNQKCPRVKLILQEQGIVADFFLLPLDDFDIVVDIDWLSKIGDIFWNFSKLTIKFFSKGKQVVLRWSQATTTTAQHLERLPKDESSGFPIQIQEFHEIEDKNPLPHLAEILDVSTKPSRLPPLKLSDPPMLNWPKLLPTIARPNCFLQPQKVKDKRVTQEITETWIVRPCLFPLRHIPTSFSSDINYF